MIRRASGLLLLCALGCATASPQSRVSPAVIHLGHVPPTIGGQALEPYPQARQKHGLPAEARGALLAEVLSGGPADQAGLRVGDLIQAIDGAPVETSCALLKAVAERPAGQEVRLSFLRGKASSQVSLRLADTVDLTTEACDRGDAYGCQFLGAVYTLLGQDEESAVRAAELYQRSCEAGFVGGCSALGSSYLNGKGVRRDEKRALELFEQACEKGDAEACTSAGRHYGCCGDKAPDNARAAAFFLRACAAGDPQGCRSAGSLYYEGRGVEKEAARAADVFRQACEMGVFDACTDLGYQTVNGEGVPRDEARAVDLFRRACEGNDCAAGDPLGCNNLAILARNGQGIPENKLLAAIFFQQACAGGVADACAEWGGMLGTGEGLEKDEPRAAELYERGCDLGSSLGCYNLGVVCQRSGGGAGPHAGPRLLPEGLRAGRDGRLRGGRPAPAELTSFRCPGWILWGSCWQFACASVLTMPAVQIRDLPPEVIAALKRRATRHERSLEGELRHILATIARQEPPAPPLPPLELKLSNAPSGPPWRREDIYGDDGR